MSADDTILVSRAKLSQKIRDISRRGILSLPIWHDEVNEIIDALVAAAPEHICIDRQHGHPEDWAREEAEIRERNAAAAASEAQDQSLASMLRNDMLINDAWAFTQDFGREDSARRLVLALAQRIEELRDNTCDERCDVITSQEQTRKREFAEALQLVIAELEARGLPTNTLKAIARNERGA